MFLSLKLVAGVAFACGAAVRVGNPSQAGGAGTRVSPDSVGRTVVLGGSPSVR